jgi:hypothetical protein
MAMMTTAQGTSTSKRSSKAQAMAPEQSTEPTKNLPPEVFRHWIHSREEDYGDVEVFRPEGFDFPPSRSRDGFEMQQVGRFIQDVIAPTDGVVRVPGSWRLIGPNRVSATFVNNRIPDLAFEILSVDTRMLRRRTLKVDAPPGPRDEPAVDDMHKLPPSTAWRRIDFERAEIRTLESFPPQHILVVRGLKPFLNMEVDLEPVVYIRQPEYWEIEVLGRLRGAVGLTAVEPYTVTLPLAGVTGTRGVEVMGANKSMRLDLLPGSTKR